MSYRIVLAEDQSLIRDSLKTLLESQEDLIVIGTAGDGIEALELCRSFKPDIALLDIRMPRLSGIKVAESLRKEKALCRIVLLTTFCEEKAFSQGLSLGVEGIFLKDIEPELFADSLRAIARGLLVYHPAIASALRSAEKKQADQATVLGLTEKDMIIIKLIAGGESNKGIAFQLGCTEGTVKNRVSSILSKMSLEDRTQIAVYAIRNNLLDDLD